MRKAYRRLRRSIVRAACKPTPTLRNAAFRPTRTLRLAPVALAHSVKLLQKCKLLCGQRLQRPWVWASPRRYCRPPSLVISCPSTSKAQVRPWYPLPVVLASPSPPWQLQAACDRQQPWDHPAPIPRQRSHRPCASRRPRRFPHRLRSLRLSEGRLRPARHLFSLSKRRVRCPPRQASGP